MFVASSPCVRNVGDSVHGTPPSLHTVIVLCAGILWVSTMVQCFMWSYHIKMSIVSSPRVRSVDNTVYGTTTIHV